MKKPMSYLEISAKLRAGKTFEVLDKPSRNRVYGASRVLGTRVTADSNGKGGFVIRFVNP